MDFLWKRERICIRSKVSTLGIPDIFHELLGAGRGNSATVLQIHCLVHHMQLATLEHPCQISSSRKLRIVVCF